MKKNLKIEIVLIILVTLLLQFISAYKVYASTVSGNYTYNELSDGTISIVGYSGTEQNITVPSTIDGKLVTKLGTNAFKEVSTVKTITLPEGLLIIDSYAFNSCSNLTTINMPSTLNFVSRVFYKTCPNLTNYTIPSTLTKIDSGDYQRIVNVHISGTYNYDKAKEVVELVNEERASRDLNALEIDNDLMEAAMRRAAETSIYWDHTRPDGGQCFDVCSKIYGENIGVGTTSATIIMSKWMNSPGHKAQIIKERYKSMGVGCYSYNGLTFWVQVFSEEEATDTITSSGEKSVDNTVQVATDKGYINPVIKGFAENNTLSVGETLAPTSVKNQNAGYTSVYTTIAFSDLTWESSDENVFTVDKNGTITAKGAGEATLTASIGEFSTTYNITVIIALKSISIEESATIETGSTYQLAVTYNPKNTTESKNVTWSSSDTSIASVDDSGKVTGIKSGTAVITATVGSHTAICTITVKSPYLKGDINNDGKVNILDINYGLQKLSKKNLTEEEIQRGDVTGDGKYTILDVNKVLIYLSGKIKEL